MRPISSNVLKNGTLPFYMDATRPIQIGSGVPGKRWFYPSICSSTINLFDAVVTCFPSPSWWRPEISFEARATQRQNSSDTLTTAEGSTYAGIVAKLPLYSAAELDREREREANRRASVAQTVGKLEKALADRRIHRRELTLARAVEARSGRRVAAGIAETAEQLTALNKVASLESQLISDAADLTAARLLLVGMCKDRTDVESALVRLIDD